MESTDWSPEEAYLLRHVQLIQTEVTAILGNAERSPDKSMYRYSTVIRIANRPGQPLDRNAVNSLLAPVKAAHPEATIEPVAEPNWIDVDISVRSATMAAPAILNTLSGKGLPFSKAEAEALASLAAATAAKVDTADPSWSEVAAPIAVQARAFAELLMPTQLQAKGCTARMLGFLTGLGPRL